MFLQISCFSVLLFSQFCPGSAKAGSRLLAKVGEMVACATVSQARPVPAYCLATFVEHVLKSNLNQYSGRCSRPVSTFCAHITRKNKTKKRGGWMCVCVLGGGGGGGAGWGEAEEGKD